MLRLLVERSMHGYQIIQETLVAQRWRVEPQRGLDLSGEAARGNGALGRPPRGGGPPHAAIFQIGKAGSRDQVAAEIDVRSDARKKLYAILVEDLHS